MNYRALYGENADENEVRERYRSVAEGFRALKGEPPESFYSSSGRAEIIGNHTDHNHGKVIVAAITCDIVAAVKKRNDGVAEIVSKGFKPIRFRLSDTSLKRHETGRSASLARGVAAAIAKRGFPVKELGGFSAYTESTIFRGAGVSSSAAFEVLVAEIFNSLYLKGRLGAGRQSRHRTICRKRLFRKTVRTFGQSASLRRTQRDRFQTSRYAVRRSPARAERVYPGDHEYGRLPCVAYRTLCGDP